MYLANRLNELRNPILARKVGKYVSSLQTLIGELYKANVVGQLSAHSIGMLSGFLRERVEQVHRRMLADGTDELVTNLTANVMMGDVKRLQRKVMEARHSEQLRQRILGKPITFFDPAEERVQRICTADENAVVAEFSQGAVRGARIKVEDMHDPVTPEKLVERSIKKLDRRGKPHDWY